MLKQEIVYIPKEMVDDGTFPRHLKGFVPKEGYFFTNLEIKNLFTIFARENNIPIEKVNKFLNEKTR